MKQQQATLRWRKVLVEQNARRLARAAARRFGLEGQLSAAEEVEMKAFVASFVRRRMVAQQAAETASPEAPGNESGLRRRSRLK